MKIITMVSLITTWQVISKFIESYGIVFAIYFCKYISFFWEKLDVAMQTFFQMTPAQMEQLFFIKSKLEAHVSPCMLLVTERS